ncbi:Sterol regulatory element binding protein cleavage-activating protein [Mycena venus]|uniref:Sterol regulatory element binding protein cleavage-activating protein n=1 Tax=Mycena venus TaxID=2733690 RepID=A0A8H6Y6S7_9AGAR|nr:Sterol regulatory element binding protein cleavage-activating protein [Mycena venus]
MAYGPSVLLQYARAYASRFFLQFGLHCATHQIRIILVSCVVITSLFYPALALYSSSRPEFISILDVTRSQYPQDLENLWAGRDSLRVLEDAVSRGKIHRLCPVDRTLRVERILIQSPSDGAVNHRILQSTLDFERRIDELQLPCLKRADGTCFVLSPLAFWHHNQDELSDDPTILDTLLTRNASIEGIPITPQMVLAGRGSDEPHVAGTNFDYAMFLALTYFFPNSDCLGNAEHLAWLKAVDAASLGLGAPRPVQAQEPTFIELEYHQSLPHRKEWTAISVLIYMAYTGFLVYVSWSMRQMNGVHSRIGITFTALVEITVSTITSVSVCALVGFKVTMVPWELLPIVIVFVGAENMFNLVDAVTKTSVTVSVKQRIAQGLSHAGTSNTLKVVSYNSILGVIAVFATGAIRQFCVFAIVVLVAHWFLAHTFFMALDDLLRQNSSLAPAVPEVTKEAISTKSRSPWGKLAIKTQSMLRGRAMKNISLLMLLAITATLYYTTYPTEPSVPTEDIPQHAAVARNASSILPHHHSQPAWKIWKALNPHETKLFVRIEAPTVLTRQTETHGSHRSKFPSMRTLRVLFWVVKIVVLPITITTTVLWGLLLYLLKDAELLEAQRNRPDIDSPDVVVEDEDGSAFEGRISFSTLPRAFASDVELIAMSHDGGVVVSVGMQNEVIIWRMPSRVHVAIDVTDVLLRSASTSSASSTLTCVAVEAGGRYCAVGTGAGNIAVWSIGKDSINPLPLLSLGNSCAGVVDLHFLSTNPRGVRPTPPQSPPQSEPSSPTDRHSPVSLVATYESGLAAKWDVGITVGVAYFAPSPRASLVKALLLRVPQAESVLVGFCMDDGTLELSEVQSTRPLVLPDHSICAGNPADVVTKVHVCLVDIAGGTRLVVAAVTESGTVSLWDGGSGELIHILDEALGRINHLRISPAPTGPCPSCGKLPLDGFLLAFSVENIVHFFRIYLTDQPRRCSCNVHQPRRVPSWDSLGRRSRTTSLAPSPGGSPSIPRAKLNSVFEPPPFPISGHGVHSRRASEKDMGRRSLDTLTLPIDQDLLGPLESLSIRPSPGTTSLWQHVFVVRIADTVCDRGGWDISNRRVVGVRRKPRSAVKSGNVNLSLLVEQPGLTAATLERWELWSFDPSGARIQSSPLATLVGNIETPALSRSSTSSISSSSSAESSTSRVSSKDTVPRLPFTRVSPFSTTKSHGFAGFGNTDKYLFSKISMVRVRKEKGAPSASRPAPSSGAAKPSKKSRSGDVILQEQVLALGGTKADLDLVKNAKQPSTGLPQPTLSKDVSQFLKGLNLGGHDGSEERPSPAKSSKAPKKNKKPLAKLEASKDSSPKKKAALSKTADVSASVVPASVAEAKPSKKKGRVNPKTSDVSAPVAPVVESKPSKKKGQPKSDAPADIPPVVEEPKIQLPSKVTLDPKSKFAIPPASHWYLSAPPLGAASTSLPAVNATQLASFTTRASNLHATDIQTFQTSSSSNSSASEANFLSKIIQSGTLSDRLSALTLLVQSSPLHNTKALETLKGMAERGKGKGGREESLKALRCVVDWWVGGGTPDRKLKYMRDQPLSHPSVTDQHLVLWYFEDWLKKYFFSILQILETLSLDPLPYVRTQALTLISTLLRDKPEQEQNLLRLLVNKLGDTEKSICSRASHHLLQLLQSHPSMKSVIVREIIALVLRPPAPPPAPAPTTAKHIRFTDDDPKPKPKPKPEEKRTTGNAHARYYATITFNQIVLSPGDRDVALQLIDVYFELFKELLGEGNVPDVEGDDAETEGADKGKGETTEITTDKGGRVRDGGKGKGKGKGKATEVKGAAGFAEVEDAHSKLISAILTGVNRALPFAKIEAGDVGLNKHIDTLFLITHTSTFNISLQALVLIQQISASLTPPESASASSSSTPTSKSITDRYYRTLYASLHDNRLATSSKQAMYLNLLFKSLKVDPNTERVKAIVRRFVQVLVSGGSGATEFIAGGLYLLGELFSSTPGLRSMLNAVDSEDAENEGYDPRKRDPQYAHASSSPLWELSPLLHHYHPAISLHARQLLSSQPLTASADLSLNTISHFLDRFVYKNPKKVKPNANNVNVVIGKGKGASAMQPAASGLEGGGVKLMKGEMGVMEERVNEGGFLRKKEADVPVDQLFFHKFFSRKSEKEKTKSAKAERRKNRDEDSDSDSGDEDDAGDESGEEMDLTGDEAKKAGDADEFDEDDSDLGEDEIWKAMQASMPRADGDEDLVEESDEVPSDLNEDEDASEIDDDDDDALSLVEGSDNDDLVPLDADFPGLIDYDGSDEDGGVDEGDDEEWGGITQGGDKKRKREDSSNQRRKKLRSLPTFASYEDYAKMIEDGPEDDI